MPALAQNITVTGTVYEPDGETAIGVSVTQKGTTGVGVTTDIDGNFRISVPSDAILVVSYVGYETQEVPVDGRTHIEITLTTQSKALEEVVVIGYGAVKKEDATGSVAVIKPDDIEAGMATSAQDMLVGASPGVVVTTNGGQPEGGATIRIRGGSSLNASSTGNDPLIVLDGVPLSKDGQQGMSNPLAMIAPENIESMTILKDASATAIYGSRASNGVIIITTKKGQSGKPQVSFSANMYVNTARKTQKVLDANSFAALIKDYYGADSNQAKLLGPANTDWQDQVLRTSISSDYTLSVGGTSGFLPYRVSASYTKNNGIVKKSSMERVTVGFNLTPKFFDDKLSVNANVKGYYVRNNFAGNAGLVSAAIGMNPTLPIYTKLLPTNNSKFPYLYNGYMATNMGDGQLFNNNATTNPVSTLNDVYNIANVYRSNGNLQLDYALHFFPQIHLNLNLGYDIAKTDENYRVFENTTKSWDNALSNGAQTNTYTYELRRNTLLDFYANYTDTYDAIESTLSLMAGYSWQKFYAKGRTNGTVFESIGYFPPTSLGNGTYNLEEDPSTKDKIGQPYGTANWWKNHLQLISFFGRLNYSYKDTYLLTFTLRDDATSRFSKSTRWGLFPSVALGWKILNMPFMESAQSVMNEFKLRLGWGVTGQQEIGSYFPYMAIYQASSSDGSIGNGSQYPNMYTGTYYDANGNIISNTYYPQGYDPKLKWEETTTWNVGFDLAFLNNRVTAALDWYLRESRDLLSFVAVPSGSATTNMMTQNIGNMRNVGFEVTLTGRPIATKDATWTSSVNVAWNKNKITKLNGEAGAINVGGISGPTGATVQRHMEGYPANTYWMYEQVYDADGFPLEGCFVDQNADGVINDDDRVMRHSPDPKVTISWNNNVNYKNWDFGISLRASIGNYVYNNVLYSRSSIYSASGYGISNLIATDFYFRNKVTNDYLSDYFLENGGFVRCDNITLGYTWPKLLNNNLKLRVFGAVQNPFVITKYKGLDPEVAGGIDNSVYPRPVTATLGLVATF